MSDEAGVGADRASVGRAPNLYSPFPSTLRGDVSGAYCELVLDGGDTSRYIIIWPVRYLTGRHKELIDRGVLGLREAYPEIELLGRVPDEDTLWPYRLEDFKVKRQFHSDQEVFSDNAEEYRQFVFDDYDSLMDFCSTEYGIGAKDFRRSWETNYPAA